MLKIYYFTAIYLTYFLLPFANCTLNPSTTQLTSSNSVTLSATSNAQSLSKFSTSFSFVGDQIGVVYKVTGTLVSQTVCAGKKITALAMDASVTHGIVACSTTNAATTADRTIYKIDIALTIGSVAAITGASGNANEAYKIIFDANNSPTTYVLAQANGKIGYIPTDTWTLTSSTIGSLTDHTTGMDMITSPNVVVCFNSGKVHIVNYKTGVIVNQLTEHLHTGSAYDCIYVHSGSKKLIISAGDDQKIIVTSDSGVLETKKSLAFKPMVLRYLPGNPNIHILVGSNDIKVYMFDAQINDILASPVYDVSISTPPNPAYIQGLEVVGPNQFGVVLSYKKDIYFYCTIYQTYVTSTCKCPSGYYNSASDSNCLACPFRSLTCSSDSVLLSCRGDRTLSGQECLCTGSQKYDDNISDQCQSCVSTCLTCLNGYSCDSCSTSTVPKMCTTCLQGNYEVTVGGKKQCKPCSSVCSTCISSTNCLTCKTADFKAPECLICINGKFLSGSTCLQCSPQCATCENSIACLTCADSKKQLPDCFDCQIGMYYDGTSCLQCQIQCAGCINHKTCLACQDSKMMLPDCLSCFPKTYYDSTNKICKDCLPQCASCSSGTACLTCLDPKKQTPSCSLCISGYFLDTSSKNCIPCMTQCATCSSATSCQTCTNVAYTAPQCLATSCQPAPQNKYFFYGVCKNCMSMCSTCSNGYSCAACNNGMSAPNCTVSSDNCTSIAANQYWDATNQECVLCDPICAECLDSATNCKTCSGSRINPPLCKCQFQCASDTDCSPEGYCTSCRGDRVGLPLCQCPIGFYDDLVNDDCKPCRLGCLTCKNAYQCLTCPSGRTFNSGTNQCDCDVPAPSYVNATNYCITCDTEFPFISFSSDLSSIILDFKKSVVFLVGNPANPLADSCVPLIDAEQLPDFGESPLCYQKSDQQIAIVLGKGNIIEVGTQLKILPEIIKVATCTGPIVNFVTNTVNTPLTLVNPIVEIQVPIEPVSLCGELFIYVSGSDNDGNKGKLKSYVWSEINMSTPDATESLLQGKLSAFSTNNSDFIYLRYAQLSAGQTYFLNLEFTNFLDVVSNQVFTFSTSTALTPILDVYINQTNPIYPKDQFNISVVAKAISCAANKPKAIAATVVVYAEVKLLDDTVILQYNTSSLSPDDAFLVMADFVVQPHNLTGNVPYKVVVNAEFTVTTPTNYSQTLYFQLPSSPLMMLIPESYISWTGKKQNLTVTVQDPDELDADLSTFTVHWSCMNMVTSSDCEDVNSNPLTLNDGFYLEIENDTLPVNQTYRLTVTAVRDTRIVYGTIYLIITDVNIPDSKWQPSNTLSAFQTNVNDELPITLKVPPVPGTLYYGLLVYKYKLIGLIPIDKATFRVRIGSYNTDWSTSSQVTIFIAPLSDSIKFEINTPPQGCVLSALPSTGVALSQIFTISVGSCQDSNTPLHYQLFYYFDEDLMTYDQTKFLFTNGFPLSNISDIQLVQTYLPPGNPDNSNKIFFLAVIKDNNTGISYATNNVTVTGLTSPYSMKDIVDQVYTFFDSKFSATPDDEDRLMTIALSIAVLRGNDMFYKKCKNCCSENGECSFKKKICECDAAFMLPDCSGNETDDQHLTTIIQDSLNNITQLKTTYSTAQQANTDVVLFEYLLVEKVMGMITGAPFMKKFATTLNQTVIADQMTQINSLISAQLNKLAQMSGSNQTTCDFQSFSICGGASSQVVNLNDIQAATDTLSGILSGYRDPGKTKEEDLDTKLPDALKGRNDQMKKVLSSASQMALLLVKLAIPEDTGQSIISADNQIAIQASVLKGSTFKQQFESKKVQVFELLQPHSTLLRRRILDINPGSNYEVIQTVYAQNPYAYDGVFPYPSSLFPVVVVEVRQQGGAAVSQLDFPMTYYFDATTVASQQTRVSAQKANYVCIQLQTNGQAWTNDYCETKIVTAATTTVECSCKLASATTTVDDYNFKFTKNTTTNNWIPKYAFIIIICTLSGLWLFASVVGMVKDCGDYALKNYTVQPMDDVYESKVGRNRNRSGSGGGPSYLDPRENDDSDTVSFKFKNFHPIIEAIVTYRPELSRLFRLTNIFMRYIAYFAFSGYLVTFNMQIWVLALILGGIVIFYRIICNFFNIFVVRSKTDLQEQQWISYVVYFFTLGFIGGAVFIYIMAYNNIAESDLQTWFFIFLITIGSDWVVFDILQVFLLPKILARGDDSGNGGHHSPEAVKPKSQPAINNDSDDDKQKQGTKVFQENEDGQGGNAGKKKKKKKKKKN